MILIRLGYANDGARTVAVDGNANRKWRAVARFPTPQSCLPQVSRPLVGLSCR